MSDQPTTCGARRAGDTFPGCVREVGHPGYHHEKQADRDVSWSDDGEWYVYHRNDHRSVYHRNGHRSISGKTAAIDW